MRAPAYAELADLAQYPASRHVQVSSWEGPSVAPRTVVLIFSVVHVPLLRKCRLAGGLQLRAPDALAHAYKEA